MATGLLQTNIPLGSHFSDAFWDDDNRGVDILFRRLKKSKETCEEIRKLYESRAHIEQEYGEKLLKLSATSRIGEFEEGSFAETLCRIPSTLETTARAHIDLAQQLRDHLEMPLDGFLKEQRQTRKSQYMHIENLKQLKKLHENEVIRTKEHYYSESSKLVELENHYTTGMEKEIEEQKRLVAVAEQVYKRAIDNLNSVNEQWIHNWKNSADIQQEMEIKRISYLRSTLWSFSNMMTSTFNIDEECCDRIRAALEITDIQKDIIDFVFTHKTGTKPPAIIPYELFHQKSSLHQSSSESLSVLSNNNEELKSVDIQLQRLEQVPRNEVLHESPLTDQSQKHINSAMEEVEYLLNQGTNNHSEPAQSVPPMMLDHNRTKNPVNKETMDQNNSANVFLKPTVENEYNPNFDGLQLEKTSRLDDEDYENSIPRPSLKDEKWLISSIRGPQQVPINPSNNQADILPAQNMSDKFNEEVKLHQAKAHKPSIPLSIEIPNPVNKNSQLAAHKAIQEARKYSQMPPEITRAQNQPEDNAGIRPAPWQEVTKNTEYIPQNNYRNGYNQQTNTSQINPDIQQVVPIHAEKQPKNKTSIDPIANKPGKESKTGGRFSLFFTGGNKKEKKKETHPDLHLQEEQELEHENQPPSHHAIYQPNTTNNFNMDNSVKFSQSSQTVNRFMCYVKAQWPFEATIDAEMSFNQDEVIGIIHKQSDGWWQAERLIKEAAGQRGLVPGNYMIETSM